MVRFAREEIRSHFGVDVERLCQRGPDVVCGVVRRDGVLWHAAPGEMERRLEWFLVEMLRATSADEILYLEVGLPPDGVEPGTPELLSSENRPVWQMRGHGRLMLVYRPRE